MSVVGVSVVGISVVGVSVVGVSVMVWESETDGVDSLLDFCILFEFKFLEWSENNKYYDSLVFENQQ